MDTPTGSVELISLQSFKGVTKLIEDEYWDKVIDELEAEFAEKEIKVTEDESIVIQEGVYV